MKEYPSIPHFDASHLGQNAYIFRKEDGSNLRFEYSPKIGFYKFGSRKRLIDRKDLLFGEAVDLFLDTMAKPIIEQVGAKVPFIAYCEFFGPSSFAGQHSLDESHELKLIDVNMNKQGMLSLKEFVEKFGDFDWCVNYYLEQEITRHFVDRIQEAEGFEGVVCKWGASHNLRMCKIKTKWWLNKLKNLYREGWEQFV